MTNKLSLTWKEVLRSSQDNQPIWEHIKNFLFVVAETGYEYFEWNGNVYKLIRKFNSLSYEDTGIDTEDLP